MIAWFVGLLKGLMGLLPKSPFADTSWFSAVDDYLGWLNWVFPFQDCLTIFNLWLGCLVVWYSYRFAKKYFSWNPLTGEIKLPGKAAVS